MPTSGGARLPKDPSLQQSFWYSITQLAWLGLLARRAVGLSLSPGSDFASRWLVLDYGAEGYVGQVGAPIGLTNSLSGQALEASIEPLGFSGASPTEYGCPHSTVISRT